MNGTVVQTVLTATFNSYGNGQISTPHKINIPEPIDKKNRHNRLHQRGTTYTKFDFLKIYSLGASGQMGEI